jgi:hypothetical protein
VASFTSLDWDRFDLHAIILGRGLARMSEESVTRARDWLAKHGYKSVSLDFSDGLASAVGDIEGLLEWERNFGYSLDGKLPHVAAIHEGLQFLPVPEDGGLVLELSSIDSALVENEEWTLGFLRMIARESLQRLALGRRFFAVIYPDTTHPALLERALDDFWIPNPFRFRGPADSQGARHA